MPDAPPIQDRSPDSDFEDLLVEMLAAVEAHGPEAIEATCRAHPEHAPRLRSRLQRLSQLGMLATATGGSTVDGIPERLGDYRLRQRIGGGGMGMVFLAEQVSLGRRVAVKLIRPEQLYFAGARDRFARETKAIASLNHPAIVPVHGAGEEGGLPWLAMDYVDGISLEQVLVALAGVAPERLTATDLRRALPNADENAALFTGSWVSACVRIARTIAEALQHAHERGVLHRDIKPSNIMLTATGQVLLLDFGLALSEGSARLTLTHMQLGSPAYMSPEQVRGQREADCRTDVYSLGVTLYELLTLHAPFVDQSVEATRALVLAGRAPEMRRQNPSIPRDVDLVCRTAMNLEPQRRYADAAAFAEDLGNVLALRPVRARPPTTTLVIRRLAQRHPALATALVAALLLLVIGPTVFWLQQRAANATIRVALADAGRQRDRAREAVQFMLTRVAGEDLLDVPRLQRLRRDLFEKAQSFHERFLRENGDDPDLLEQATDSALQLAILDAELGRSGKAHESATRAVELTRSLVSRSGANPRSVALLAGAQASLAATLQQVGRLDEALARLREAMSNQQELRGTDPNDPQSASQLLGLRRNEAMLLSQLGRPETAADVYDQILEMAPSMIKFGPEGLVHEPSLDQALGSCSDAAQFFRKYGRTAEAMRAIGCTEALRTLAGGTALSNTAHLALARVAANRARILDDDGDPAGGEAEFGRALAEIEVILERAPEHANALRIKASILNDLSLLVRHGGLRNGEAGEFMSAAVSTMRRLVAVDPTVTEQRANLAASLLNQAGNLRDDARFLDAAAMFEEAIGLAEGALRESPTRMEWRQIVYNATWLLGLVRGQLGDHRGQMAAAERLAALRPDDAKTLRIAAGLVAAAVALIAEDTTVTATDRPALRSTCATRAIELLNRAADLGCTDAEHVRSNTDFDAIRAEAGFGDALARIEALADRK